MQFVEITFNPEHSHLFVTDNVGNTIVMDQLPIDEKYKSDEYICEYLETEEITFLLFVKKEFWEILDQTPGNFEFYDDMGVILVSESPIKIQMYTGDYTTYENILEWSNNIKEFATVVLLDKNKVPVIP